jgi:O-antigen/teichoic acid export membrane protein
MMATAGALVIMAAAYPAAAFFHEPRLVFVMCMLGGALFVEGLQNIKLVNFRRQMRFDREFFFLATRRLVTVCVTMIAAFTLRNEWALAIGLLASRIVGTTLSYWMQPYCPRFSFERRSEFAAKSSWLLLSGIVVFIRQRSSDFVLGRMMGTASVGAYTLASDLSTMVTMELVVPINRVTLSDLSSQRTREDLVQRFDAVTGLVAIALTPLGLGLAACAKPVVLTLLGPKWSVAADTLEILAIANVVAMLVSNIGVPIISLGYYRYNAIILGVGAGVLVPALIGGVYLFGAVGAAVAVLVGNTVTAVVALSFARQAMNYGFRDFARTVWRPVLAASLMALAVAFTGKWLAQHTAVDNHWAKLAAMFTVGGVLYPTLLAGCWAASGFPVGGERRALGLLAKLIVKLRRKTSVS